MEEERSYIEGVVEAVVYQNEENGYTVLRLDVGADGTVTVVGCLPGAAPGENIKVGGSWTRHASYGEQFKADTVERRMPAGEKAIFDYLASGAVKGIGAATARKLVAEFGDETLSVLEERPEELTRAGLTRRRALMISESFRSQMGMRRLLEFLTAHALPIQMAMPLYRQFGDAALERLREDPYLLVGEEIGASFGEADALALDLGMDGEDPRRLEAGILFELRHNLNNGHTFLPREKLLGATGTLLHLEEGESLEAALETLLGRGEAVEEETAGERAVYLFDLYNAECFVADRLGNMSAGELVPPRDLEGLLKRIEREQGITYAPQQRQAVELAARSQIMLLTGGPGTGKTTSLRGVLALFEHMGLETALAAPTGRAAKRLGELCGMEAYTIHRLLEPQFDPGSGRLVFARNISEPLKADAVIVDETSMVDLPLMQALLCALREDCRLVLVGDPDQLPSVGPGNLLRDLLRSGRIPTVRLTEIFRQAAESAIVRSAHSVDQGEMPDLRNRGKDFFFLRRTESARAAETIVELCGKRLPEKLGIPFGQIQVLSPTRRGITGTASLNRILQAAMNPPEEGKGEKRFMDALFREGDRVMQVRNNYDVLWRKSSGGETGMGIFNGDIGIIQRVDNRAETVTVDFDGRVVEYTPDMLPELESAYAVTVHKAQGSEYRSVILAVCDGAPMLLTRGVLYTAITRARELFILVGDDGKVAQMVHNDRQQRRYSGLRARLAQF